MNDEDAWNKYIKFIKKLQNTRPKVSKPPFGSNSLKLDIDNKRHCYNSSFIDLHGYTVDQAFQALKEFLKSSFNQNKKQIVIITGKGSAEHPSILKLEVPRWLQYTELNNYISKFQEVKNNLGEAQGTINVFLKKNKGEPKYE